VLRYYLYYEDTMRHRAMHLMSKKMAAALALEGEFSEDALAAIAGDDNMQIATLAERFAQVDAGMWAAAHAMARGVGLEPVAAKPETGPVRLKVYETDPEPETHDVLTQVELPEFDEALLAKTFANLAAHGMTLQDLAG
jgi:hypothetical protein